MNLKNYLPLLILSVSLSFCQNESNTSSELQVDHLNIWVENPQEAKESLMAIGFTAVPDSLSAVHEGQGTAGRYFNFLNGYLELIFVHNQEELEENNLKNKGLDFTARANFNKNGASPFSVALNIKNYDIEKIPFEIVKYHQVWMEESTSILSAKNSKINLSEPSIFVVYPEIESAQFETMAVLDSFPGDDNSWKTLFKHPNGAQKITDIKIVSTDVGLQSETVKAVNGIESICIKSGEEHIMELTFDNNLQGKTYDLRPELPLIVKL